MQKVSLYVDAKMWKRLKEISKETMVPVAALIRKALEDAYSPKKR
jgi:predicted DNA-binding ribbon-helix-helix protein